MIRRKRRNSEMNIVGNILEKYVEFIDGKKCNYWKFLIRNTQI